MFAWISPPLALLNIVWEIEKSSGNEKTVIRNEDYEIFLIELECENEIMKKTQEGLSIQTKKIRILENDEKGEKILRIISFSQEKIEAT